ncbi:hypothetical protein [Nonomuraea rubra]|uniref:hypothetical protein n=1 Tax=Nonomuraea rubra TaxID=46180 RepID=UPI0033D232F8
MKLRLEAGEAGGDRQREGRALRLPRERRRVASGPSSSPGFSRSAGVLLDRLRVRLERRRMRLPDVRASTLGDECVVVGAIGYALDHLDELFTPGSGPLPVTR